MIPVIIDRRHDPSNPLPQLLILKCIPFFLDSPNFLFKYIQVGYGVSVMGGRPIVVSTFPDVKEKFGIPNTFLQPAKNPDTPI